MAAEEVTTAQAMSVLADVMQKQTELAAQHNEYLAQLRASQPPRVIHFGDVDYQEKLAREARAFKTVTLQNGAEADPYVVSDLTIETLPKIKAGRYLGGMVEVETNAKGAINFRYSNKTPDQRMAQMRVFSSFDDLVAKVWAEQQARSLQPVA